ncbi:tRNA (N(6)-L-threonylcarbamoyladenosine(37)-C(2))-methylthiotransferase MtaB [Marinilabiliaceae bacterium JC017]|nr:tRNA (N(6)-L-threonylcarbamoyladenosine(37)-C(2))-methylthiotransferase MtaB [Marinilabiliaceae bacterium JC017]
MIDKSVFENKKAAFFTLGCKLNFSETSSIARTMREEGFQKVSFNEKADVYVINTCSVTEIADKKCKQAIKKAIRLNPEAFIVVTGCFAQLKPESISNIEGVDLILGSNEKFDVTSHLGNLSKNTTTEIHRGKILKTEDFKPSYSMGDRTRCFLKIQDGCDYFCSYCTIPLARGRSRSNTIAKTVELAKKAVSEGAHEIILTGVNIGDFGKHQNETFFELIQQLDQIEDIHRFRISSIEPNLLTDEIIEFVAKSKKFMPHFHIPIQSGNNQVLQLMKRRYNRELFADRVKTIKQLMPHAFIGVDVIVGVRGETIDFFNDAHQFLSDLDVSQLHVFTYSERPNTQALKIDDVVPIPERKRRSHVLHQLSEKKLAHFYRSFLGQQANVLLEGAAHNDTMHGFTENYIKVEIPYDKQMANTIKQVQLKSLDLERNVILAELI